jgi:hypothetical protein
MATLPFNYLRNKEGYKHSIFILSINEIHKVRMLLRLRCTGKFVFNFGDELMLPRQHLCDTDELISG